MKPSRKTWMWKICSPVFLLCPFIVYFLFIHREGELVVEMDKGKTAQVIADSEKWKRERDDYALGRIQMNYLKPGLSYNEIHEVLGPPTREPDRETSEYDHLQRIGIFDPVPSKFVLKWTKSSPRTLLGQMLVLYTDPYKYKEHFSKYLGNWQERKDGEALSWLEGNFLKEGLTYDEVIAVLGKPQFEHFEDKPPGGHRIGDSFSEYYSKDETTSVTLSWDDSNPRKLVTWRGQ